MYLLASDYDGTLNCRGVISDRDREAIRRFRAAGNLFGVVTGRDYPFYTLMRERELELDFILAMNGAMTVITTGEDAGSVAWAAHAENRGVVRGIADLAGRRYHTYLSCVTGTERATFHADHPEGNGEYLPLAGADRITHFTQMNTRCASEEEAGRCTAEINAAFGDTVNALQNGDCIDIPPRGIDKGEGVARFAAERGIPEKNVYCAGDSWNDIAMVSRFHGCAVKNACPALKAAAEGVYDDVAAMIDAILTGRA